jgi:hypothetical protein
MIACFRFKNKKGPYWKCGAPSVAPVRSSVWYQVKVDPDKSPSGANWINVRPDLWESFHQGDTVCVHVGIGLFAIRWYPVVTVQNEASLARLAVRVVPLSRNRQFCYRTSLVR